MAVFSVYPRLLFSHCVNLQRTAFKCH